MPKDNAGVLIWPPLLFALCAGIGIASHFIHAMPVASGTLYIRWLGGILALSSAALAIWAARVMKKAGTNVRPDLPTLAIVRRGPYRFSRNPMYVSLCLLQLAISLLLNDWIPLLLVSVLLAVLHFGVVLREEAYLERKFGSEYLEFKKSARRWI